MAVVAITGGARGIGRATATAFVAAGARVAIGDLELAAETAAELGTGVVGLRAREPVPSPTGRPGRHRRRAVWAPRGHRGDQTQLCHPARC